MAVLTHDLPPSAKALAAEVTGRVGLAVGQEMRDPRERLGVAISLSMGARQAGDLVQMCLQPSPEARRERRGSGSTVLTCTQPLHRPWQLCRGHAALSGNREKLQRKHRD